MRHGSTAISYLNHLAFFDHPEKLAGTLSQFSHTHRCHVQHIAHSTDLGKVTSHCECARCRRSGLGGVVESSYVLRTLATTAPCDACRGVRKLTGFAEDQHPAPISRVPHCARASIQASAPHAATGLHSTRRTSKFGRRSLVMVNQVVEIKPRRSRRRRDGRSRHARAPTSIAFDTGRVWSRYESHDVMMKGGSF